jgi:hypothetical protein
MAVEHAVYVAFVWIVLAVGVVLGVTILFVQHHRAGRR